MFDPYFIRKDFPMFTNKTKMQKHDLVFFDNASTTFKPQCVIDAMNFYNEHETSNSGRGDYDTMYQVDQAVLETRKAVANFINSEVDEVIFTSGATAPSPPTTTTRSGTAGSSTSRASWSPWS